MQRRRALLAAAAIGAVGLAGCLGGGSGSPDDGEDGSTDTPPSNGGNGTPSEPATSFGVLATRCGNQVNRAEVTVDGGTVTVEGATWGNDACYSARLESATLDGGTLTFRVVTERAADDDENCAQCISEIEYRATVETTSTPDEVVVVHDGETVERATV